MKTKVSVIALILVCVLSLGLLTSCQEKIDESGLETTPSDTTATNAPAYDGYTLNGTPIGDYTVIFSESSGSEGQKIARLLVSAIKEKTGESLSLRSDVNPLASGKEIVVGDTNRMLPTLSHSYPNGDGYVIAASEGKIFVYGADMVCTVKAIREFERQLSALNEEKRELTIENKSYADLDTSLVAMSFNLWIDQSSWQERAPAVLSVIKNVSPDTFGVQEADIKWMNYLSDNLPNYAYVGVGRDGGTKGEYSAVFYRTDVFELFEGGTQWLSDTPSTPSKYSESAYNRIFSYALLNRKSDGRKILHINTHLDHISGSAREKQTAVLVNFLNQHNDVPVLLSGDFNAIRSSRELSAIFEAGYQTSADLALCSDGTRATFPSGNKVIDYIFVKKDICDIYEYRVDTSEPNGIQPSDHYPVYIQYDLK